MDAGTVRYVRADQKNWGDMERERGEGEGQEKPRDKISFSTLLLPSVKIHYHTCTVRNYRHSDPCLFSLPTLKGPPCNPASTNTTVVTARYHMYLTVSPARAGRIKGAEVCKLTSNNALPITA